MCEGSVFCNAKNGIIFTRNVFLLVQKSLWSGFHGVFVLPCYTASVSHQTATVYPRTVCCPHKAHDRPNKLASCLVYGEVLCGDVLLSVLGTVGLLVSCVTVVETVPAGQSCAGVKKDHCAYDSFCDTDQICSENDSL